MRTTDCAAWCSGALFPLYDDEWCEESACIYDERYRQAKCECDWRGPHCSTTGHEFRGVWLHGGYHLICTLCKHDGT